MTATYDKIVTTELLGYFKGKQDDYNEETYLGITAEAASAAKLGNDEAIGGTNQPVYFSSDGVPVATTYSLGKSVPSDAVFTDTTYSEADPGTDGTDGTDGLMSDADKYKLNNIAAGAQVNVIESITVGGTAQTPSSKAVALGSAAGATIETTGVSSNTTTVPTTAQVKSFVEGKGYQTSSDVQSAIGTALSTVLDWKGVVADMTALNAVSNPKTGDVYHVTASGSEYAWNGSAWEELGLTFDATGYALSSDFTIATSSDIDALFSSGEGE